MKSYDDLRQERFVLQMAAFCDKVWADKNGLPLRLHAYSIVATGPDSGFIETISNAQSLDQVGLNLFAKGHRWTVFVGLIGDAYLVPGEEEIEAWRNIIDFF